MERIRTRSIKPGFSYVIFSKQCPYESRQLSGYGYYCFAWHLAAINKPPVTFSKTLSGVVGDVYCPLGLMLSSASQGGSYPMGMPIMPGCLYEQTADVFIACLGYSAFVLLFSAG